MFNNVGGKIKAVAVVVCFLGIIASCILGFFVMFAGVFYGGIHIILSIICGIVILLLGCLLSWLSVLILYGLGQLIENSDILVKKLAPEYRKDDDDDYGL